MPTNKSLIVLQENSGRVPLPPNVDANLEQVIVHIVDTLAETFEDLKTMLQTNGKYDTVHLLTDNACSRARLLESLVAETVANRKIDLIILGNGANEILKLKTGVDLTGRPDGTIQSLLLDAKRTKGANFKFNLRMVYMCNCYGSTLNDDWIAIGAKGSVGSIHNDYMPEPMTTFFIHNWLNGQSIKDAAKNAYNATVPFFLPVYPPTVRIKTKSVETPYPCPTWTEPLKICKTRVEVPDGVEFVTNTKIVDTLLIVKGDMDLKY